MGRRGRSHTGLISGGGRDGDKIVDGKLSFLQARGRLKAVVMRVKYSGGVARCAGDLDGGGQLCRREEEYTLRISFKSVLRTLYTQTLNQNHSWGSRFRKREC
jgi:hypothetical protein